MDLPLRFKNTIIWLVILLAVRFVAYSSADILEFMFPLVGRYRSETD
jgi:hypothetical protein